MHRNVYDNVILKTKTDYMSKYESLVKKMCYVHSG